jgi:DNA-binding IclR family transcriptional regulator
MDKAVRKSVSLIEALAASTRPRGIAELATQLGLGKSNVHRLLSTLVDCGYVRRHAVEGRYELTLKLWEMGAAVLDRLDVRIVARAPMEWLSDKTGESVHLCMLDGAEVVYLDRIHGSRPLSATLGIGGRAPAHRIASGKALLAALPDEAVSRTLSLAKPAVQPAALAELMKELNRIRKAGYALNVGTWRPEVNAAGAAIRGPGQQPLAAIGIAGPSTRLPARRLAAIASKDVAEAVRRASESLCGH